MTMADGNSGHGKMRLTSMTSRYHDIHKGAMEDALPTEASNAPALDDEGLSTMTRRSPKMSSAANQDGSQG